jgi:hypothetical protein
MLGDLAKKGLGTSGQDSKDAWQWHIVQVTGVQAIDD